MTEHSAPSREERQTRSHLMRLFERHGFHPRTHLGQNFLIDLNLIEFVVREAELNGDDLVLEIGAGTGGMTTFMARQAGHVISVELDRNMYQLASEAIERYSNVTLLNQDALKNKNNFAPEVLQAIEHHLAPWGPLLTGSEAGDERLEAGGSESFADDATSGDVSKLTGTELGEELHRGITPRVPRKLKLIANLPYSIATPVISNLVATEIPWSRMVVTIQFEVGQRMQATTGDEHYGALSVWLQSQCHVEMLRRLPPTVFWPRPKVDSAIMKVTPNPEAKAKIADRKFFHDYIRRVFNYRRKFLRSVLCGMYRKQLEKSQIDALLESMGFTSSARAEELDVDAHVALGTRLQQEIEKTPES